MTLLIDTFECIYLFSFYLGRHFVAKNLLKCVSLKIVSFKSWYFHATMVYHEELERDLIGLKNVAENSYLI